MKIQGRFIAILAVLGLLIALLPLASVGAVTGVVTITGDQGGFFSDRGGHNIITIQVEDQDISPTRKGTARSSTLKATDDVDLRKMFVSGEKDETEQFHGGVDDKSSDDKGEAIENPGPDGDLTTKDDNTYTFTLASVARDRQAVTSATHPEVAVINEKDIKSVVVNGSAVTAAAVGSEPASGSYFTVAPLEPCATLCGGKIAGGGIKEITLHKITPQPREDSVSITFRETEFKFTSVTPLNVEPGKSKAVHGGANYFSSSATISAGSGNSPTLHLNDELTDSHVVVTFGYDVKDSKKGFVTLNSGSAGDRSLDGLETNPASSQFSDKVAIFSRADYTKITTEARDPKNKPDEVITIADLNFTYGLSDEDDVNPDRLSVRVQNAAVLLELDKGDPASDFVDKIIPARDGDVINVTYADTNPAAVVSKAVTVDMSAPTVRLVSPSDNLFTNTGTAAFIAEVTDTGAGVDQSEVTITATTIGGSLSAVVATPIVNGYRLTAASQAVISEGEKTWFVGVKDKVGNVPAKNDPVTEDVNEAPKGAASFSAATADNPFKFTVDIRAPTLLSAKTGLYLKNPGATSGTDKEEQKTNGRQWVRALFDLGVAGGAAPLDATTVSANDFRVNGATPIDVKINVLKHDATTATAEAAKGAAVYLQVGSLDTDAKPKVELVGEIRDMAGNIRTDGRLAASADGLAPVLTVTPSADIAPEEVTITVTSSERLRSNPTVSVTPDKPVKDTDRTNTDSPAVSLQTGSLTTWTVTYKKDNNADRYYVVVEASDQNDNTAKVGVAADEDDFVSFQLDDKAPGLKLKDSAGEDLETTKQEEGAVWLVMEFDEDEHKDDKYRKVEVTEVTLTNMDTDEVVTEDVSTLFDSEVACVDHDVTDNVTLAAATDEQKDKCAEHTLPVNLTPGMYNIAVTGVDQTGNEESANVDFEVTEAEPFELTLRPGQNFISIKGMPMGDGGMLDNLFSDPAITSVSTYDRSLELQGANPWLRSAKDLETGMFSGDITMIEPGKAYFVNSSASVTVEVKLQSAGDLPPTIPVRQGYNAIGFWSISGADDAEFDLYLGSIGWSVAYSYDPTPGVGWTVIRKGQLDSNDDPLNIEAGKGYLVYATYDAVLTP